MSDLSSYDRGWQADICGGQQFLTLQRFGSGAVVQNVQRSVGIYINKTTSYKYSSGGTDRTLQPAQARRGASHNAKPAAQPVVRRDAVLR